MNFINIEFLSASPRHEITTKHDKIFFKWLYRFFLYFIYQIWMISGLKNFLTETHIFVLTYPHLLHIHTNLFQFIHESVWCCCCFLRFFFFSPTSQLDKDQIINKHTLSAWKMINFTFSKITLEKELLDIIHKYSKITMIFKSGVFFIDNITYRYSCRVAFVGLKVVKVTKIAQMTQVWNVMISRMYSNMP